METVGIRPNIYIYIYIYTHTHTHTHTHTQFPDQFSIGNSDHDPSKINIDYLIIEGLQLEESRKNQKTRKCGATPPDQEETGNIRRT